MNWQQFFHKHNIYCITSGKNVKHGNINIKCPWCGDADPSQHMGIDPHTGAYACWRNSEHRGRKPQNLIIQLLGCSYADADLLVGTRTQVPTNEFGKILKMGESYFLDGDKKVQVLHSLKMPDTFKPITRKSYAFNRFAAYLVNTRGFEKKDIKQLVDYYNLHYCLSGPFKGRVIIPVYLNGKLISWTGRSIYGLALLKYKTLSANADTAKKQGTSTALAPITETLLDYNRLLREGGNTLYVCEGPFDAMKIDFYGSSLGLRATCVFTKNISNAQINYLTTLTNRFNRIRVFLDPEAEADAIRMAGKLASLRVDYLLPTGDKDPGDLSPNEVRRLAEHESENTDGYI